MNATEDKTRKRNSILPQFSTRELGKVGADVDLGDPCDSRYAELTATTTVLSLGRCLEIMLDWSDKQAMIWNCLDVRVDML